MPACSECGAVYASAPDDCASRFDALLALDHSRTEPWGSRHALAFSAFALQHPAGFPRDVIERAWILLFKVYEQGDDYRRVTDALRRAGRQNPHWDVPTAPAGPPPPHFAVTIADLGSFAAEAYPQQLDNWCKASLHAWRKLKAEG
jgi:hypothetical protein